MYHNKKLNGGIMENSNNNITSKIKKTNFSINNIESTVSILEYILLNISMLSVASLLIIVSLDVISRYILRKPIHGGYEIAEILLVFIIYTAISYLQKTKGHIAIDIVTSRLPENIQVYFDIFGNIIGLFCSIIISWQTFIVALHSLNIQEISMSVVKIPLWPGKFIIAIGFSVLSLRLIIDILSSMKIVLFKQEKKSLYED